MIPRKKRGSAFLYLLSLQFLASPILRSMGIYVIATGADEHAVADVNIGSTLDEQAILSADYPLPTVPRTVAKDGTVRARDEETTLSALIDALAVMQSLYFQIWPGTWPSAIDWTAAVMGTQVSATLSAISDSLAKWSVSTEGGETTESIERQSHENMINQYFTQVASFYHGENAFSLRTQAYDDMLWVVLGWLESVKFIRLHSRLHYAPWASLDNGDIDQINTSIWYAQQFIPQFAHRANIFYELASHGWDTTLCGGGMVWNPYLAPYKNAITNQLFIAASVSMYLYFPGDDNASPFSKGEHLTDQEDGAPAKAHDLCYLKNAIDAYDWLRRSNMTNAQGLYIDGFHIRDWRGGQNGSNGTGQCDLPDEKVYTYNQGVILSGLRGLWDSTGLLRYLQDGHRLIRSVINATGWDNCDDPNPWVRYRWAGLGRNGVMEEACDASGTCSQNAHTFKGIWWHHFTLFCAPLEETEFGWDDEAGFLHRRSCQSYREWVERNAKAAVESRNEKGQYGTWWGKHPWWQSGEYASANAESIDYRNIGVPDNEVWRLPDGDKRSNPDSHLQIPGVWVTDEASLKKNEDRKAISKASLWDPNDRGRGRTVETQSGGLAVLRALYKWEAWY